MGVLDGDEAYEVSRVAAASQKAITLGGSVAAAEAGEDIVDADFSDGTAVLARNATAKANKKKAAQKDGPKVGAGEVADPAVTAANPKAGDRPAESETPAAEATASASPPAPGADEANEPDEDETLVAEVEAAEKALKGADKGSAIAASKGALMRIIATAEKPLADRARKLINGTIEVRHESRQSDVGRLFRRRWHGHRRQHLPRAPVAHRAHRVRRAVSAGVLPRPLGREEAPQMNGEHLMAFVALGSFVLIIAVGVLSVAFLFFWLLSLAGLVIVRAAFPSKPIEEED